MSVLLTLPVPGGQWITEAEQVRPGVYRTADGTMRTASQVIRVMHLSAASWLAARKA